MRKAFTLLEMLLVLAIIVILFAMAAAVYFTAAQQSRGMRTRAIVAKIDSVIGEKWESYRTRQVPIRIQPGTQPTVAAQIRLDVTPPGAHTGCGTSLPNEGRPSARMETSR